MKEVTFYPGDFWKEANELFKCRGMTIDLDRMWQTEILFDIPEISAFPVISITQRKKIVTC